MQVCLVTSLSLSLRCCSRMRPEALLLTFGSFPCQLPPLSNRQQLSILADPASHTSTSFS